MICHWVKYQEYTVEHLIHSCTWPPKQWLVSIRNNVWEKHIIITAGDWTGDPSHLGQRYWTFNLIPNGRPPTLTNTPFRSTSKFILVIINCTDFIFNRVSSFRKDQATRSCHDPSEPINVINTYELVEGCGDQSQYWFNNNTLIYLLILRLICIAIN